MTVALTVTVLTAACAAGPGSASPGAGSGHASAVASEPGTEPLPSFEPGPPAKPTPLTGDPLWQRAGRGDVIDLGRLADRTGAVELLEVVELGGTLGLTALSALPHAEDAELALGPLCRLLVRLPAPERGPVVRAIEGILSRPPSYGERLDARGLHECRTDLARLAAASEASPSDRDRIANARALLEEWLVAR